MTSTASCPVSAMTSATVRDSQRRLSGWLNAPSRRSDQPPGPVYDAPRVSNSTRRRSRADVSARRPFNGPGPPDWIQPGSWISRRVLAHSDG